MKNPDPYKANRQFERAYFNGVPELPYSMYEQNSYSFHLIRLSGIPEHVSFEGESADEEIEVLGTIRTDYKNNLIYEE